MCLGACGYLPAQQERARSESILDGINDVVLVTMDCGSTVFAGDQLCAEVMMKDGAKIHFSRVGSKSFGAAAQNIVVDEAGGLVPRVASCGGVSSPNFHRDSPFGRHFHPTLIDVKEAVSRYRELMEEVQWWPQCPQFFEVQDNRGQNYRYCSRKKNATEDPPRPSTCS